MEAVDAEGYDGGVIRATGVVSRRGVEDGLQGKYREQVQQINPQCDSNGTTSVT